jgi:hypothetical protein
VGWQKERDIYFVERDIKQGAGIFSINKEASRSQIAAVMQALSDAGFSPFEYDEKLKDARSEFPWGRGYDVGIRIFDR